MRIKPIVAVVAVLSLVSWATLSFAEESKEVNQPTAQPTAQPTVQPTKVQPTKVKAAKKAGASMEIIKGTVVSINTPDNQIVIKESKTGTEKTIVVNSKIISKLKVDDMVRVIVKPGSNVAKSVKILKPESAKETKKK